MRIVVLSGKGGTGKTTVSTHLAQWLSATYVDLDVEEPNGHLFLHPEITEEKEAVLMVPAVDPGVCIGCGRCVTTCQYNALAQVKSQIMLFEDLCHGCGACTLACPVTAIVEEPRPIGRMFRGKGYLRGELRLLEVSAVPVIHQTKAWMRAGEDAVIDAPPGTSCPVIAAMQGADYAVIVTEPTAFGVHDLARMDRLLRDMHIPAGVVINRSGDGDAVVEEYLEEESLPLLGRLPFSTEAALALSKGQMLWDIPDYREAFDGLFQTLVKEVGLDA